MSRDNNNTMGGARDNNNIMGGTLAPGPGTITIPWAGPGGIIVVILQGELLLYNDAAPDWKIPPKKGHTDVRPFPTAPPGICKKKGDGIMRRFPAEILAPKKGYTDVYLSLTALFRGYF